MLKVLSLGYKYSTEERPRKLVFKLDFFFFQKGAKGLKNRSSLY
jgi:hypothetical protein